MKLSAIPAVAIAMVLAAGTAVSPQPQPAPASGSDLYHVHFTKAVPGQAAALGKALMQPDTTSTMPDHFVVLRHQEGDDWDYVVIQHLGQKAALTGGPAAPNPARDLRAWHSDTFVSGPSWAEFIRQMGIGGSGSANAVYTTGVHRAVPGHRDQLEKALNQPASTTSKIQTGSVFLQHVEGSEWTFMTITRHNSWQDFAADRVEAAASAASTPGGWSDIRQHSAFHRDTIADRIFPAK
jgi:hypothetical protein